jgi:integrase
MHPEDLRQLKLALGVRDAEDLVSFRELAADWLESVRGRLVAPDNERRHLEHLEAALGGLNEETLAPMTIMRAIDALNLGPVTKNKVRSTGARVINAARLEGRWRAGNPFEVVPRWRESRRVYEVLTLDEASRMLAELSKWRPRLVPLFRTALMLGGRKGELLALRKEDVDLVRRLLWFRRSHGRNQTKTGKPRHLPIPETLLPYIEEAMAASKTEYVFPHRDGGRMAHHTKLTRTLRWVLGLAGVVKGYTAKCRRQGCGHRALASTPAKQACPNCGMALWMTPIARPLRFYDLRHTAATLHREAGCDPLTIKIALGHASRDTTDDIYTHVSPEFMRRELEKLVIP